MMVGAARGSEGVLVGSVVGEVGDVEVGFPKTADERVHDVVTTNRIPTIRIFAFKRDFMVTCPYL